MDLGSPFYIGMLSLLFAVAAALWLLLRKKSRRIQKAAVLCLMVANTLQHFLKSRLYPQYFGLGFSLYSTAYNVCGAMIILAPAAFLWGSRFWKNSLLFLGSAAGLGAIALPFWYFGMPVSQLGWNYGRFYLCHGLLFLSSFLPLALGLHSPKRREFWQVGFGFLLILCLVTVNNVIFMTIGLYPEGAGKPLYDQLLAINPCMLMGPKGDFGWLEALLKLGTPPVLLGDNPSGHYAPILWYALPVYTGITLLALPVFWGIDKHSAGD